MTDRTVPDHRYANWPPPKADPSVPWGIWFLGMMVGGLIGIASTLAVQARQPVPCDVQASQPPFTGPFRPRPPRPDPTPPIPEPQVDDLDARERRLLGRIREWVEERAKRAEERSVAQLQDEILTALDTDPEKAQGGAWASVVAAKLAEFVKRILKVMVYAAVIAVLWAIVQANWVYIAAGFAALVGVLRLWIGAIAAKSK